jgi:hypothetical protein
VRTLFLWLGLIFAAVTGVFWWASTQGFGWAAVLCGQAPVSCVHWDTFAYAAGAFLVGYVAMVLTP